jgi:ribosomal protein S18 acetylase RimI-like enzyme
VPVSIRRAALADLDPLVPLFDAYRQFYGQAPDPEGARRFLSERLQNEESVVLLALLRGEGTESAVGFVQLYPIFTSVGMRRVWILNDLFVAPGWRRSGIARQLMQAAAEFARATGASQLRLATARHNGPARALYEALGYRRDETFDHYQLGLGTGGEDAGAGQPPRDECFGLWKDEDHPELQGPEGTVGWVRQLREAELKRLEEILDKKE